MPDSTIKVENVSVIYNQGKQNEVRSLQEAAFTIYPGEYVIFFGPSGCGKSTLLYSIASLQSPTVGEVYVSEKPLSKMTKKEKYAYRRRGVGMVFQAFYLIPSMNILDNVCLPRVFLNEDKRVRREAGRRLLERFGIEAQADKYPGQLSGGQKQRVAIARALINDPEFILADEPVGNLDSESARTVLGILKELNEKDKKTIILVTHDPNHLAYGDRIFHMKDGRVIQEEVHIEKRPAEVVQAEILNEPEESRELKLLMRSFRGLPDDRARSLINPFKSRQLLNHVLSSVSAEQLRAAEMLLQERLAGMMRADTFVSQLDLSQERGGAGWNRIRAKSFTDTVESYIHIAERLKRVTSTEGAGLVFDFLSRRLPFSADSIEARRVREALEERFDLKIDFHGLGKRLDDPVSEGGAGLRSDTVEHLVSDIETILLLKF
jgi:putative ABC transport system ATP-binding protein